MWSGREGGREADEKFGFSDFLKNLYLSLCCFCVVLCTIYGFSNVKAVQ